MMKKSKVFMFTFIMMSVLGFTLFSINSTYAVCPDDIQAYWKLDETTAGTYTDFISGKNGTGNADPAPATGTVNGAQQFDPALNTGIDVAADRDFNWLSTQSFSIEFWINMSNTPGSNQVAVGRTGAFWFVGVTNAGLVTFELTDNGGVTSTLGDTGTIRVDDGAWHHVVAVRDDSLGAGGTNLLYVDGDLQDSEIINYTNGFFSNSASINIGYLNTGGFFRLEGLLDEVAIYDRALPEDEIDAHRDAGLGGNSVESLRPAPSAIADADPTNPTENTEVTLDGTGSSPGAPYFGAGSAIASYLWEETTSSGVTINNANTATATFTAPDVAAAGETLTFRLTVTADDGQSDSDTVTIEVNDGDDDDDDDDGDGGGGGGGGGGGCFISSMF